MQAVCRQEHNLWVSIAMLVQVIKHMKCYSVNIVCKMREANNMYTLCVYRFLWRCIGTYRFFSKSLKIKLDNWNKHTHVHEYLIQLSMKYCLIYHLSKPQYIYFWIQNITQVHIGTQAGRNIYYINVYQKGIYYHIISYKRDKFSVKCKHVFR